MKIIFRTDASIKIGSGHVMRCLTLAEELKKNGASVLFISRKHSGNLNHLISIKGFQVIELNQSEIGKSNKSKSLQNEDDYRKWLGVSEMQDAEETVLSLNNVRMDWLIVDHYALGEKWENELRPHVKKIMVIDDQANRPHDCDLLLDQNWFENMENRYDDLVPVSCTKLLGPEYAMLRPEFAKARKSLKPQNEEVNRIFVFFGGTDPCNLTRMTIQALSEPELTYLEVDVVIGGNNPHQDEIQKTAESRELTNLHVQVDDMAAIMAKADLAIGAGGVNTWERMCLGLPALVVSFAENHKVLLGDLAKNGYVNYYGSALDVSNSIIKKGILDELSKTSVLSEQSNDVFQLVDGQGTGKVAKKLLNQFLSISIVSDNDSWINDYIPMFIDRIENKKHSVNWVYDIKDVKHGDICFLISCSQIMLGNIMTKNKINLVAHESAVPIGKGWSPLTWQILEGKSKVPISLLEVADKVDSGKIYLQDEMVFKGHELIDELRSIQAKFTFKLCEKFIDRFPSILNKGKEQEGKSSFYKKRGPKDSKIDTENSISGSFNLLRTVDNERYPAFFYMKGEKYKIKIERYKL